MTNQQIAEVLGVSISNVKVQVARAKDVLQSRLERVMEA
jgi:DNA-directed RNA polymerase specialized sigma24 family protein